MKPDAKTRQPAQIDKTVHLGVSLHTIKGAGERIAIKIPGTDRVSQRFSEDRSLDHAIHHLFAGIGQGLSDNGNGVPSALTLAPVRCG
jgi:hypothetical protein